MGAIDPPLTETQRSYLEAFDRLLAGKPGARALMGKRLRSVLDEAGGLRDTGVPRRGPRFRVPSDRWS